MNSFVCRSTGEGAWAAATRASCNRFNFTVEYVLQNVKQVAFSASVSEDSVLCQPIKLPTMFYHGVAPSLVILLRFWKIRRMELFRNSSDWNRFAIGTPEEVDIMCWTLLLRSFIFIVFLFSQEQGNSPHFRSFLWWLWQTQGHWYVYKFELVQSRTLTNRFPHTSQGSASPIPWVSEVIGIYSRKW
jgi:hypothetical protein